MQKFKVLLYYKYVEIKDPDAVRAWQKEICERLHIKGRILISEEGLNGTCAGSEKNINKYIEETVKDERFKDVEWKISFTDRQIFPKLKVKYRPEVVTLGLKKKMTDVELKNKANYIEPEELLELYEKNEDFVILDARNFYEAKIGKFKDALIPPIDNFREFPEFVEKNLENYKDKNVVTYCTGGIRCEKASAYLRENGFKKVRQLHGGIHNYADITGGKYFEGEMFVFDDRISMPVNNVNPKIITNCEWCGKEIARYIDCANSSCSKRLFICCNECEKENNSCCSDNCKNILKANLKSI